MGLKTYLYIASFFITLMACILYHPFWGIAGYVITYNINPLGQWWGQNLPVFFHRFSFVFAMATIIGIVIHYKKLRFNRILERQEVLLLFFIFLMWMSSIYGLNLSYESENLSKMVKVSIIILMASHLITDFQKFDTYIWILIISSFYLAFECNTAPAWQFMGGRLHGGIGGSDFGEGNFLAAHFLMILPWVGIFLIKYGWKIRIFLLVVAALIFNSLIIIESRGAFLAVLIGIFFSILLSNSDNRKIIILLLVLGSIGASVFIDTSFIERMGNLTTETSEMDKSSSGRIDAWKNAYLMAVDHPLGIGIDNFKLLINNYNQDVEGLDTHSTYFRCLAELGWFGLFILLSLIANAFSTLSKIKKNTYQNNKEMELYVFASRISLIMFLFAGAFITELYIEEFYWLLMLPVFLKRASETNIIIPT